MKPLSVPAAFARSTIEREGEAGRAWIAALPSLAESFLTRWDLDLDGAPLHGYVGLVLPVRRGGEPCVLKLSWIDASTRDEAAALRVWNGRGAVRLLDADPDNGALLLERLDPHRSLTTEPIDSAAAIAGRLLRELGVPCDAGFADLADYAAEQLEAWPSLVARFGAAVPHALVDEMTRLLHDLLPARDRLLVDYDLHYENVLAGMREPWLAIDPKVVLGEAEFGVAPLLSNRLDEIIAAGGVRRHLGLLVEAAGLDAERARAWTRVRNLDSWLWALSVGLTDDPARCVLIEDALR